MTTCIVVGVAGCVPELAVPAGARLSCRTGADCPSDAVCVEGPFVCEPASSACVTRDGATFHAAPDGNACHRGARDGICRAGVCEVPTCGDGFVDDGEACDDGDDNANAADACRTTCLTPVCGDGIVDSDEQCDGADVETGSCGDDCYLLCDGGRADVDGEAANGCEVGAELLGPAIQGTHIEIDDDGAVWWNAAGAGIVRLAPGASEPEEVVSTFAFSFHVGHGLLAWFDGGHSYVADLASGDVVEPFSLDTPPECGAEIPDAFAECQLYFAEEVVPLSPREVLARASGALVWADLGIDKATRVVFDDPDSDVVALYVFGRAFFAATADGRIVTGPVDGTAPAIELADGQLAVSAIVADEADVFWLSAIDGRVGRLARSSGSLSTFVGGRSGGHAIALAGDDVVWAADAGSGDPGRVFLMRRDGGGLRAHSGGFDELVAVAVDVDDDALYWLDAGAVLAPDETPLAGVYRTALRGAR